jgi:hypothetical protein
MQAEFSWERLLKVTTHKAEKEPVWAILRSILKKI